MLIAMLMLGGLGLLLLLGAPLVARLVVGAEGDPVGLKRILWVIAAALLLLALLARPHSDQTAAFPPSPDQREPANAAR